MEQPFYLAVDGGGSKTHLALFDAHGRVRALVEGPTTSPHFLGQGGAVEALRRMIAEARVQAGLADTRRPSVAALALHGLDLPEEEQALALLVCDIADEVWLGNDILAVLRSGSESGWGVAVGAGSGMNAVGVHPDGTTARFLALGAISGDWGGGWDLGRAAIGAACRSVDGRGPATELATAVPRLYGLPGPLDVAAAFHRGDLDVSQIPDAARPVLALADSDAVSGGLVDRLAEEIALLAVAAATRAGVTRLNAPVVLSGGLIRSRCARLLAGATQRVEEGLGVTPTVAHAPPIAGAALLAADRAGLGSPERDRLATSLRASLEGS